MRSSARKRANRAHHRLGTKIAVSGQQAAISCVAENVLCADIEHRPKVNGRYQAGDIDTKAISDVRKQNGHNFRGGLLGLTATNHIGRRASGLTQLVNNDATVRGSRAHRGLRGAFARARRFGTYVAPVGAR